MYRTDGQFSGQNKGREHRAPEEKSIIDHRISTLSTRDDSSLFLVISFAAGLLETKILKGDCDRTLETISTSPFL